MSTVRVNTILHPAPGQIAAILRLLERLVPEIHAEAGCETYAVHTGPDREIVIIEKWATEGAYYDHQSGSARTELARSTDRLCSQPAETLLLIAQPMGESARATF